MSDRTVTRSVETDVEPDLILNILRDPRSIPKWVPVFADTVETDGPSGWRVIKDGRVFSLEIVVEQASRTVDYLRETAPGKKGGAYIRVLPRPNGGSVVVMTLPIPPDTEAASVTTILSQELETLVKLSKSRLERDN